MKRWRQVLLSVGISIWAVAGARGSDWPQFRGVGGAGVSADPRVPTEWGDQNHLVWKAALPGRGSSSPIIVGSRVFVTCYSGYGDDSDSEDQSKLKRQLLCLDRKDGHVLWTATVDAILPEDAYRGYLTEHGYASSTPASDGQAVYVFFGKSGVLAFDLNGKRLWQTSVGRQSDTRRWGSAASPVLYKDLVIVNASSESQSVRALDKATGKQVWAAEAAGLSLAFGTPALVNLPDGHVQLVVGTPGEVWGLNPENGKLAWFAQIPASGNLCPSVVAAGDVVYVTGGFESHGTVAIRAGGKGDVTRTHVLWTSRQSSYVPSPLVLGGNLYCVDDTGRAVCLDVSTGNVLHEQRLALKGPRPNGKPVYASLVAAGDKLIAVTRTSGVYVLQADRTMNVIALNQLSDDSGFNATPAMADGELFLRSNSTLYCVGFK